MSVMTCAMLDFLAASTWASAGVRTLASGDDSELRRAVTSMIGVAATYRFLGSASCVALRERNEFA